MNLFGIKSLVLLLTVVFLTACTPPSLVAVEERQTIDPRVETERIGGSRIRIVQPGDTLHAIAFVHRLDVNKLAAWNRLADTSHLNIGQRIRLTRPLNFVEPSASNVEPSASNAEPSASNRNEAEAAVTDGSAKPLNTKSIGAEPLGPISNTNTRVIVQSQGSSATGSIPRRAEGPKVNSNVNSNKGTRENSDRVLAKRPVTWIWPTAGKLIGYFSASSGQQGIDIQGQTGQAVLAAGAGQVVYVGNGLKGYGNLAIIKHNEQFLSAYAHNKQLFVREGQSVASGQRIASLGKDNKQRNALHFQIRNEGQPVNPLSYLPKR